METNFQIITGEDFTGEFFKQIMDIDKECYTGEYIGELSNMVARYKKNNKSFICVMDKDKIVGYINFFPVGDALWNEIIKNGSVIRDDDIEPREMADYKKKR